MKNSDQRTVPLIQYILFTVLVVVTPFVMVSRFLQGAVYTISHLTWIPFGIELPIVGSVAVLFLVLFIVCQRKNITRRRIIGFLVIAGMIGLAYLVQDLYLNMVIYDLQMNWHYVAYAVYVYIFFAAFHSINMSKAKMILISFFSALSLSTFDEFFQLNLSQRIFDLSDIAKDSWGATMGIVSVLFVSETYGTVQIRKKSFLHRKLKDYWRDPVAALTLVSLLSLSLLLVSPILTEHRYIGYCTLASLVLFISTISLVHLSSYKPFRISLIAVAGLLILFLATNLLLQRQEYITRVTRNVISYKGIPIPYFDLLIYPNGLPRLTDKKEHFNQQDQRFMKGCDPDILLIGSGYEGEGGKGFRIENGTSFIYNPKTKKAIQLIIMKTHEACVIFNKMKKEGKNVLFVAHNS